MITIGFIIFYIVNSLSLRRIDKKFTLRIVLLSFFLFPSPLLSTLSSGYPIYPISFFSVNVPWRIPSSVIQQMKQDVLFHNRYNQFTIPKDEFARKFWLMRKFYSEHYFFFIFIIDIMAIIIFMLIILRKNFDGHKAFLFTILLLGCIFILNFGPALRYGFGYFIALPSLVGSILVMQLSVRYIAIINIIILIPFISTLSIKLISPYIFSCIVTFIIFSCKRNYLINRKSIKILTTILLLLHPVKLFTFDLGRFLFSPKSFVSSRYETQILALPLHKHNITHNYMISRQQSLASSILLYLPAPIILSNQYFVTNSFNVKFRVGLGFPYVADSEIPVYYFIPPDIPSEKDILTPPSIEYIDKRKGIHGGFKIPK